MEFIDEYLRELIISIAVILTLAFISVFKQRILMHLKVLHEKYLTLNFHFKGRTGKITFPNEDAIVSEAIRIKGNYNGIRKNDFLWVFTEIDNLVWPKKRITQKEENLWDEHFQESYAIKDKPFRVSLVCANNFGNKKILEYLENCSNSNPPNYPGRLGFVGTIELDSISLNTGTPLSKPKKNK